MSDIEDTVADLAAAQQEELAKRRAVAQAKAHALAGLMLGEELDLGEEQRVMAVPGGWIFWKTHKAGISGVYVPGMQTPKSKIETPDIILPGQ
jgi:hypothetical protein